MKYEGILNLACETTKKTEYGNISLVRGLKVCIAVVLLTGEFSRTFLTVVWCTM